MSRKAIFCLVSSQHHAEKVVTRLKNRGFHHRDISALYSNGAAEPEVDPEQEPVATDAVANPAVGALAWLQGIGQTSVPGYIAAGPLVRALKQTEGAASSKVGRGLIGLGVPEPEAKSFQRKIKQGSVLISFHTEHSEEITRAQAVLQLAGGEDFCGTDESMPTQELSMFGEETGVRAKVM